ncbi:MAG: oxidoreductase [Sphingomonas bacterium]|uniref:oxidoreductase n=1 Tax=Sphingomonas bacterium TaxID=1895847 RepID=UPI00262132F3|nr:oxidoreductase [Sphingomonas bacterium]MDB5703392.1 oxidoreductase [Sphingomonas bacterium]
MIDVGLIGFGLAGASFHAPLVEAVPRLRLKSVVTSRTEEVAKAFPQATTVASAEALIADPSIGLIVIATPNDLHAPLARAALEAGKHVVIDKPFAVDPADGEALITLAKARGLVLSVFHNRRWDSDFRTVLDILAGGALGEVMLAELRWDRFRPEIKQGWREATVEEGGGMLADLGPHLIDQALQLFGAPEAITADVAAQRAGVVVDDYFELTLHYGERRVIVSASTLVVSARPRFSLHGTRGSFVKYGLDQQEALLRAGGKATDPGYGEDPPETYGTLTLADGTAKPVPTLRGDWRRYYQGVADAILDGAPPPVDPADALTGLHLIALARRSADEGRTLPF